MTSIMGDRMNSGYHHRPLGRQESADEQARIDRLLPQLRPFRGGWSAVKRKVIQYLDVTSELAAPRIAEIVKLDIKLIEKLSPPHQ